MFEKSQPERRRPAGVKIGKRPDDKPSGVESTAGEDRADNLSEFEEGPLRELEWDELTTRLRATRDLRELLQTESGGSGAAGGLRVSGFARAADRYLEGRHCQGDEPARPSFDTEESQNARHASAPDHDRPVRQRPVNPIALFRGKASVARNVSPARFGNAEAGGRGRRLNATRETTND
ncbi:MAG: hypothetical protein WA936_10135 [Erythrobacter sp.]|uniref:hypothetical protein n=1 Tax=Erythrobacter sp. TaxID=1042 RepID=UPI003C788354